MGERLLEGRVGLVTGAGRGIGRVEAMRLAAYGAAVVVNDVGVAPDGAPTDEAPAAQVAADIASLGGTAVPDTNDISTAAGGAALVQAALDRWGRIDIVVNNAGIGRPHMVFNMSEAEWDDVIRVHLKGTFAVSAPACRWWREEAKAGRGGYGRIINTSTGLVTMGGAGQSNYVAAKAGVLAFSDAIATEMAPYGVTVNTIMPGARTRLAMLGWRAAQAAAQEGAFDRQDPVHVAELVCYLASPAAGWISGQCFNVSGGYVDALRPREARWALKRDDRGWTAEELIDEVPRAFGAGPLRAERPPKDWQERYRASGVPVTATAPRDLERTRT